MSGARHRGESVLAGTAFGILTQVATGVCTAVLTLYLVRTLGAADYGRFALALSVLGIAVLLADLSLASAAGRFVADRRDDADEVRRVVAAGLRLKVAATAAVAVALLLLAHPLALVYGQPGLAAPLRLLSLSLVGESMMLLVTQTFIAERRLALNALMVLVESVLEVTLTIALVALGGGIAGATLGRGLGYAVGAGVGAVLLVRLVGRLELRRGAPALQREIRGYARPLFATNAAYTAYAAIDTQLIAVLLTSGAVGAWAAPFKLLSLFAYGALAVANAIAPRMSLAAAGGPDVGAFNQGLRVMVLAHVAIAVAVVVWAEPLVSLLLGDGFGRSVDVLRGLGPMILLLGISPLISNTVNYLGQASRRLPIVLVSLAVNAAIDAVLLPTIGVVGAAIGTTAAYLIYVPAHLRLVRQAVAVDMAALGRTVVRSVIAGAAMAAVLLLGGTDYLPAWRWAVGVVAGAFVYVAVLVGLKEVTRADLALVTRLLPSRS